MVAVGEYEKRCDPVSPNLSAAVLVTELAVTPHGPIGPPGDPLVRWDWNPADNEQFIGISCPTGWCDLHSKKGPVGSTPARTALQSRLPLANPEWREGAYDLQYLAKYANWPPSASGSSNELSRDGTFGFLYPDPSLHTRTQVTDYVPGQWYASANVFLDTPSETYEYRLNLQPGILPPMTTAVGMNAVSLCHSIGENDCGIPKDQLDTSCGTDKINGGRWYARIVNVARTHTLYRCVVFQDTYYTDDAGNKVSVPPPPGVVRWRWEAADETIWISCPTGCCKVQVPG